MPKTVPISVRQITNALWGLEDWARSIREVLAYLPEGTTVAVPRELVTYEPTSGGTPAILLRGCPPPEVDEECDEDGPGKGHGYGHDKDKDKDKDKKKTKKTK